MSAAHLPNIYIAGAQKCGTTSLFDWLSQHPDFYAPIEAKDYPFFTRSGTYSSGRNRFDNMFVGSGTAKFRLGAEANALYSPLAIERMYNTIPQAKILVMLRNPTSRCISAWRFARERLLEERSFTDAIAEELSGGLYEAESDDGLQKNYIAHSNYSDQIARLANCFPEDQIVYLIYEEFFSNPSLMFSDLLSILNAEDSFTPQFENSNRTSSAQRSRFLSRILYQPRRDSVSWKAATWITTPSMRATIRRTLRKANRKHSRNPEFETIEAINLKNIFSLEVEKVEALLGRRIDIWHE